MDFFISTMIDSYYEISFAGRPVLQGFAFAQTSIYTEFGPIGAANYLGGFGINVPVTVKPIHLH
jgi:hypothetical protein